jgi:hypothetical protein
MMARCFHILPQASSNHLPIAAKKPRLEAAPPCMPIADILRPTHGTYLLDAWYIPHHMTVSRSKPWSIPPEREKCMFYVELTSFGTDIFCHKATKKFIFHLPAERLADESGLILARGFMSTSRGPDSRNERSGCAGTLRRCALLLARQIQPLPRGVPQVQNQIVLRYTLRDLRGFGTRPSKRCGRSGLLGTAPCRRGSVGGDCNAHARASRSGEDAVRSRPHARGQGTPRMCGALPSAPTESAW